MISKSSKIVILVLSALLCTFASAAQNKEAEDFKVDSALYAYQQLCKENLQSPVVLAMADTLFRMAGEKGDQRMQAVALCTKLDYYYYRGEEDSIVAHTDRVKEFAARTKQSKYYFFVWGKRQIQFYIKNGKLNTALYESDKMLKEAMRMDDKEGLANCYNTLATIYKTRGLIKQVYESRLKEVELIETYDLDRYNISLAYDNIADYYLDIKEMDKALEALQKAESTAVTGYHQAICLQTYMRYYLLLGQTDKAYEYLQQIRDMFATDKRLASNRKTFYTAEYSYYYHTRQYAKALEALDRKYDEQERLGEEGMALNKLRERGKLYYIKGDMALSAKDLMEYIELRDSVDVVNEVNASGEFSALLDVEKLHAEKNELALQAKESQLRYIRNIILLLAVCLGVLAAFLYRVSRLNKQLKSSETQLIQKNASLTESEEKLSVAKEAAEQASAMKSIFIRNMTHEIRTPLNSIVGFSQLLAEMLGPESEGRQYVSIIMENNRTLLKLIDDVLDMSDLDAGKVMDLADVDVNLCCSDSMKAIQPYLQPGVKLDFLPGCEEFIAYSNGERISQVLFNLLHNAAKATSRGGITLTCDLSENRRRIVFTVTDTGPGIPADKREEVFQRFVKIDNFAQGSGLGLAICRLLAQKMGGDLTLDADYTTGCRFVFTLPYVRG